ncbi:MAG TPA: SufS family cysteine desulfurase [Thermoanaerobaculia bacterium]|nr:SufS family cysteine desulfurase [Thermoanaerobaculia bacterium]
MSVALEEQRSEQALAPAYDLAAVRAQFPILAETVHDRPLVYLDNAATTQKPERVIAAVSDVYRHSYANVARGVHRLAERATDAFERSRAAVQRFLGAASPEEIVFVRGTTEAINLVAASWGSANVRAGDEVLITGLEHHANLIPWQRLCAEKGAHLRVAPVDERGEVSLEAFAAALSPRTRLAAFAHVSNVFGTVLPVREMVELAHRAGALALVDGPQAAPHLAVDVQALGCDFYAFSGHKVYGPSGIGALFSRAEILREMPPFLTGGGMVRTVGFETSDFADPPTRFEAGTQNLEGAVGLAAALEFLDGIGRENAASWERALLARAVERLAEIPGVRLLGAPRERASLVSFVIEGVHPHDAGTVLDSEGIAVRVGHLCAQPLMASLGVAAVVRASFALYNTLEEVEALPAGLSRVREVFGR